MRKSDKERAVDNEISVEKLVAALAARGHSELAVYLKYETESTSRDAKEHYDRHGACSAVFIADGQIAGRGRRGRSFASPHGAGIYMSLLVCPSGELRSLTAVTTLTSVAVCRAIERVSGLSADVKWVNDIYYKGKKLGGILTEGALADDMRSAKYVIIGIGLNVGRAELPEGVREIATSLEEATGVFFDRNRLICEILTELLALIPAIGSREVLEEYKRRSFLVGREVTVHKLGGSYPARVLGIDEDMSLRLRLADGSEENLSTGEVSVREK